MECLLYSEEELTMPKQNYTFTYMYMIWQKNIVWFSPSSKMIRYIDFTCKIDHMLYNVMSQLEMENWQVIHWQKPQ